MIKPEQMVAYNEASKRVEEAADILDKINIARINHEHRTRLEALVRMARELRHELFHESHDAFLRARGLKD